MYQRGRGWEATRLVEETAANAGLGNLVDGHDPGSETQADLVLLGGGQNLQIGRNGGKHMTARALWKFKAVGEETQTYALERCDHGVLETRVGKILLGGSMDDVAGLTFVQLDTSVAACYNLR